MSSVSPRNQSPCPTEIGSKDTALIIEHWQCRSTPGYKPVRLELDGKVHVWGDAGSWSGAYGHGVTLMELLRYYRDTKRALTPTDPARGSTNE